ncbi:argininosuccinate lyase [Methanoplanus sp. FWC-SCC4]|uniref:Argininosuccinate lyase n=1 Tax=Methanochimaera problematica TaxID=2609417 RepID=A0AA97I3B5_9EURY|nr:argininosuccinate lyase [Methanoplanus sp. FWC-SCC4]WOF15449.1 argininosuccinate lyase [Methanoplanus sp. FWC-SCC4]
MSKDPLREGRLGDERPAEVWEYLSSMQADRNIGQADILVDISHLLMLEKQEIVDRDSAKEIMKVLLDFHKNGLPDSVYDDKYEDIHAGIEAHIIDKTGIDKGGRLHVGRSRNDEVATCVRVRLRNDIIEILDEILYLRSLLIRKSSENKETFMPGFTHLQHAQPTTLAHYFMNYEQAFGRDFERLGDSYLRVDQCPLGAAAFASTGYPIDREYTAALLGFSEVLENSMDCVSGRDFCLEVISDFSIAMTNLSRMCEEIILWSSSFVRFVNLADAYCSTSSIMPQKKNPDCAEIMRGKTASVAGALSAAITLVKGLPMSYNRDMQDLWPHLWRAISDTKLSLKIMTGMIETAEYNKERMEEEAGKGFATATELADVMVREFGLPFRTAHGIVGRAVRLGKLDIDTLEEAAVEMAGISLKGKGMDEKAVARALDVEFSVSERAATGGPAPVAVQKSIDRRSLALEEDKEWLNDLKCRIEESNDKMIKKAEELIS